MLRVLLFVSLLALSAPAASAQAIDIKGWSAVQYNDYLVDRTVVLVADMYATSRQLINVDEATADRVVADLDARLVAERVAIAGLPAWKGDASLRDGALSSVDGALYMVRDGISGMRDLLGRRPFRVEELRALEAHWAKALDLAAKGDEALMNAQANFASKNRMILRETPAPEPPPEFTAEGLPPEGTSLATDLWIGATVAYSNQLVELTDRVAVQVNRCFEIDPAQPGPALGECAAEAQTTVRDTRSAVAAVGGWLTGDGLFAASTTFVDQVGQAASLLPEYAELWGKKRQSRKDKERINQIASSMNRLVGPAFQALQAAQLAWNQEQKVDAWNAWVLAQSAQPANGAGATEAAGDSSAP